MRATQRVWLPLVAVAISGLTACAAVTASVCPEGQIRGPDGRCVDIECNGGVLIGDECMCPSGEVLEMGTCRGPGLCREIECDDGNACTFDGTCDPADGICKPRGNEPLGTLCDQNGGKACNGAGECVQCNEGADCNDDNECTHDRCNDSLCSNPIVEDDTACAGSEGVCLNGGCAFICASPADRCVNSTIEPFDPGECPIFPSSFNRCLGTESVVNPTSCPSGGDASMWRVFLIEVEDDCNSGRNLDECDGNSCQLGSMAPGEGRIGVDNALSGLGPVLESLGENLGGVNKLLHDAICVGVLDVTMNMDLNFPEGCASVQIRSGGDFGVPIAMNLSDTTPNCLSGTLGTFPFNFDGTTGELQNVVLEGTFFEGQLGGRISGTADGPLIEALLEALGDHGAIAESVFDIRTDLGPGKCDALSLSLHFSAI